MQFLPTDKFIVGNSRNFDAHNLGAIFKISAVAHSYMPTVGCLLVLLYQFKHFVFNRSATIVALADTDSC